MILEIKNAIDLNIEAIDLIIPHFFSSRVNFQWGSGQAIWRRPSACQQKCLPETFKITKFSQGFHIVSDCRAGEVLHLCLASTIEWRQKMRELLTRQHSDLWEIAFVERCGADGQARFGLLRANQGGFWEKSLWAFLYHSTTFKMRNWII